MTIELPTKIFGRDVEGGIERALAKAEADANNPAVAPDNTANAAATVPAPSNAPVQTYTSYPDWSKFLDQNKVYDVKTKEHAAKEVFIGILWEKSKKGKALLNHKDIADLLLQYGASNSSNVNMHIASLTSDKEQYPGVARWLFNCDYTTFQTYSDPNGKDTRYRLVRNTTPDYGL